MGSDWSHIHDEIDLISTILLSCHHNTKWKLSVWTYDDNGPATLSWVQNTIWHPQRQILKCVNKQKRG